jgi:hypothetical protein
MITYLLLFFGFLFANSYCGSAQTNVDKFKDFISNTPVINLLKVNYYMLTGETKEYCYTILYESDERLYWQENEISEPQKESSRIYARDKLERWGYEGTQPDKTKYFYWNDSGNPDELNTDNNSFPGIERLAKSEINLFLHFGIPCRTDLPIKFDQDNRYQFQSPTDNSQWLIELVTTNGLISGANCARYDISGKISGSRPLSQINIKYEFNNKGDYAWIPSSMKRSLQINDKQTRNLDRAEYLHISFSNTPLTTSDLNIDWAKNTAKNSQLIGNGISKLRTDHFPQYFKLIPNTNTGANGIIIYPIGQPKINILDETLQETLKTLKSIF